MAVETREIKRPESKDQLEQTFREIGQACEELGIGHGDGILLSSAQAVRSDAAQPLPPEAITEKGLGGFAKDSETSREAAIDNYDRKPTQQWGVLLWIAEAGDHGVIRDEIVVRHGLGTQSVTARCTWLKKAGWVTEDGRKRKTRTGSKASVLVVNDYGFAALMFAAAHIKTLEGK